MATFGPSSAEGLSLSWKVYAREARKKISALAPAPCIMHILKLIIPLEQREWRLRVNFPCSSHISTLIYFEIRNKKKKSKGLL